MQEQEVKVGVRFTQSSKQCSLGEAEKRRHVQNKRAAQYSRYVDAHAERVDLKMESDCKKSTLIMTETMKGGKLATRAYEYNSFWDDYYLVDEDQDEMDFVSTDIEPEYLEWLEDFQRVGCTCQTCKREEDGEKLREISKKLEEMRKRIEALQATYAVPSKIL